MTTISKYLPQPKRKSLIQAHIDRNLCDKVKVIMRARRYTWNEVLEACLLEFVNEMNSPTRIFNKKE